MTRKALAAAANVSERHLANLEYGTGNASILILLQVAQALNTSLAELLGDFTTQTPEWQLLREQLAGLDDERLRQVRLAVAAALKTSQSDKLPTRLALIGLRGAGKTSLGRLLAQRLGVPFIELSREIEELAGSPVSEIQAMFGVNGYRRYERKALDQVIEKHEQVVIATPGGLVSDPATFNVLLSRCTTIWLQATPEDHMARVTAQGDLRPIAASEEAMADLKAILQGRSAFYAKADYNLNTSGLTLQESADALVQVAHQAMHQIA
jgi:XRE family aerobic/anaerobic benzoate catabolism transcriptional regulator